MVTVPEERPVAAVLAVVRRGDRLLLARRRRQPDLGLWGYPGGRLEAGETIAAAALRELREETGVAAEVTRLLPPLDFIRDHRAAMGPAAGTLVHIVLCPVACRWRAGAGVPMDEELTDLSWLSWAEIIALPAATASRDVVAVARDVLAG